MADEKKLSADDEKDHMPKDGVESEGGVPVTGTAALPDHENL